MDCGQEAAKFRDHCRANAKPFADFEAAFRNWLRRSVDFRGRGGGQRPTARTATEIAMDRVRHLEELELTERDKQDLDHVFGGVGT